MNILYYCDEYPPFRNGGIGTVVKLVAEQLVKRGHRVVVAGKYRDNNKSGKAISNETINGVEIYRYHYAAYNTFMRRFLTILLFVVKKLGFGVLSEKIDFFKAKKDYRKTELLLANLIKNRQIDLIEFPDYTDEFLHGLVKPIAFRDFKIPLVIRVHGAVTFLDYFKHGKINNNLLTLDAAHFNRADKICAVSEFSAQFVRRKINPKKEIDVIYNPVEDELFQLSDKKIPEDTILFFGKIVETKGVFTLIKAFNQIAGDYPRIRLKLVGDGDLKTAQNLVEERAKNRVVFQGFLAKSEIIAEIDKSLFCVLPSYFENFSMAALEVLARKKALIYTERASGRELITDSVNGLLVNPEDVAQLSERMSRLIDNPEKRESLATKGYEECRSRFSTDKIIPELEKYYRQTIDDKN